MKHRPRGWRVAWRTGNLWRRLKGHHLVICRVTDSSGAGCYAGRIDGQWHPAVWLDQRAACADLERLVRERYNETTPKGVSRESHLAASTVGLPDRLGRKTD